MAGIYTRNEVDKIIRNSELTEEQKTEQLFALHGRALDDGYVSKRAAEDAKNQAVEAAKAGFKVPDPVDPKTTRNTWKSSRKEICSVRSAEKTFPR